MSWTLICDDTFAHSNTSVGGPGSNTGVPTTGGTVFPWIDVHGGVWDIQSNTLQGNTANSTGYTSQFLARPSSENNQDQRITITLAAGYTNAPELGCGLRYQSGTGNHYLAQIDTASKVYLYKIVGGSPAALISGAAWTGGAYNSGHQYSIDLQAVGINPTSLILTITDVTTSTIVYTNTVSDSTASLQASGGYVVLIWDTGTANVTRAQTYFQAAAGATAYTLNAPSAPLSPHGITSGNFAIQANAVPSPALVVSPSDGGAGGTFSPTSLTITDAVIHTFTYTPAVAGVVTIAVTHTGGGFSGDPPPLTYVALKTVNIVFEGDSLTYGQNASSGQGTTSGPVYPGVVMTALQGSNSFFSTSNKGVSGRRLDTMLSERDYAAVYDGTKDVNIMVLLGGTNDINQGASAATTYSRWAAVVADAQSLGYKVIGVTIPPGGSGLVEGFNSVRDAVNQSIRSNAASNKTLIADLAQDARIGWDGDQTDTTYYSASDQIHFTDAGYAIVAQYVAAMVQAWIDGVPRGGSGVRALAFTGGFRG